MIRNLHLRGYITLKWVKFLLWILITVSGILIIAMISKLLTRLVFHLKKKI